MSCAAQAWLRRGGSSLLLPKSSGCPARHTRVIIRQYARGSNQKANNHKTSGNPLTRYLQSLKWVPIPLGVGFAYIGYQQFGHVKEREARKIMNSNDPEELVAKDWVVRLYKFLPLKFVSCMWGKMNNLELPMWMRESVLKFYIWTFNCNLDEAAVKDLKHYKNLGEFFRRRLKPSARRVDKEHSVISPSDGKILHFSKADKGYVEQVKGITYELQDFLGPQSWPCNANGQRVTSPVTRVSDTASVSSIEEHKPLSGPQYQTQLKNSEENDLYHCVIYLGPGDYHGFHSPTDWVVSYRRHFPGELLSVNPGVARLIKGLFNLNERVVYVGEWSHGFFSMAAVGATNVGSIKIYHDKNLECSGCLRHPPGMFRDESFRNRDLGGIQYKRGELFGEFNLGSTMVLVFEAPKDFEFKVDVGQTIKMGQPLGCYKKKVKH